MLALRIGRRDPMVSRGCRYISRLTHLTSPFLVAGRNLCSKPSPKSIGRIFTCFQELVNSYSSRLAQIWPAKWPIPRRSSRLGSVWILVKESKLVQIYYADFSWTISSRARQTLLSAACISAYNSEDRDHNDVPCRDEHFSDIEFISKLTKETITCQFCNQRIAFDQKLRNVQYCSCGNSKAPQPVFEGWKPFIERPCTQVWRKESETLKGLYTYKMYGRLEAITALDFLHVQLDTEFRKKWDTSAAELKIVEENEKSVSDIVYWETHWPKPFANRDYVFHRHVDFDAEKRICIISSLATNHPSCPVKRSMHRVTEYWSYMVVRPLSDFNQPGVEFVLTYFDNPGLSIPSAVSSWVAMTGLPNFVTKLNEAASQVVDLTGPQPALMRYIVDSLRKWELNEAQRVVELKEQLSASSDPELEPLEIEEIQVKPELEMTSAIPQSQRTSEDVNQVAIQDVPLQQVPVLSAGKDVTSPPCVYGTSAVVDDEAIGSEEPLDRNTTAGVTDSESCGSTLVPDANEAEVGGKEALTDEQRIPLDAGIERVEPSRPNHREDGDSDTQQPLVRLATDSSQSDPGSDDHPGSPNAHNDGCNKFEGNSDKSASCNHHVTPNACSGNVDNQTLLTAPFYA